jgi:predicted component of type VI protein secretion system
LGSEDFEVFAIGLHIKVQHCQQIAIPSYTDHITDRTGRGELQKHHFGLVDEGVDGDVFGIGEVEGEI